MRKLGLIGTLWSLLALSATALAQAPPSATPPEAESAAAQGPIVGQLCDPNTHHRQAQEAFRKSQWARVHKSLDAAVYCCGTDVRCIENFTLSRFMVFYQQQNTRKASEFLARFLAFSPQPASEGLREKLQQALVSLKLDGKGVISFAPYPAVESVFLDGRPLPWPLTEPLWVDVGNHLITARTKAGSIDLQIAVLRGQVVQVSWPTQASTPPRSEPAVVVPARPSPAPPAVTIVREPPLLPPQPDRSVVSLPPARSSPVRTRDPARVALITSGFLGLAAGLTLSGIGITGNVLDGACVDATCDERYASRTSGGALLGVGIGLAVASAVSLSLGVRRHPTQPASDVAPRQP